MTKHDQRADISLLLPWYAAGTLDASTHRLVAAAIEQDPELARRLEGILEEAAETVEITHGHPLGYLPAVATVHILHEIMRDKVSTREDLIAVAREAVAPSPGRRPGSPSAPP